MIFFLIALFVLALTALGACLFHRRPGFSTLLGMVGVLAATPMALFPALQALMGREVAPLLLSGQAPLRPLSLGMDPLSAFFLVPLGVLGALCAVYGRTYLWPYRKHRSLGIPVGLYNLLLLAMMVVVTARGLLLLLVAWEVMTLASYLLVTFEHQDKEVRRAGWIYLVAAHVGEACLIALLLLLDHRAGGMGFEQIQAMPTGGAGFSGLVFVLALVGFGIKAGFLPFHVWLPEAHAAAPSHVSALMSGVMIKLGLYGLMRVMTFLPAAPYWGPVFMVMGLAGALWGISQALLQRDLKRVLAYSSVENMGIIALGLGLAYWRAGRGDFALGMLAAAGAFLHLWNHVLMKGLMFLTAGSVVHACGTRDMERLGGLAKRMPKTSLLMVLGSLAIAGLPPLNGFVGEWFIYFGFMGGGLSGGGAGGIAVLLATGLFAFVGGLAALCFVRVVGIVLLGEARDPVAAKAHEASLGMLLPMALLALGLLYAAVFPETLLRLFAGALGQIFGPAVMVHRHAAVASLSVLGVIQGGFWLMLGAGGALGYLLFRKMAPPVETWGCGYAAPTVRMQYTARSFSELAFRRLFPRSFRPRIRTQVPSGIFPSEGHLACDATDPLLRGAYEPTFSYLADKFARLRWLQQGAMHIYLLYIFIVAVVALAWISWSSWMAY